MIDTTETMIDPLIVPTDMIADIVDAALSRSSVTTDRSAGSVVAIKVVPDCSYKTVLAGLSQSTNWESSTKAASIGGLFYFAMLARKGLQPGAQG